MAAPRAAASSLQRHISGGGGKRGAAQLLRPAPPEVRAVVDALAALHGRPNRHDHAAGLQPGCELKEPHTVLDSLVRTILSQNTTDVTSQRAYTSLKQLFPAWEQVRTAPAGAVEQAIRVGGLADIKAGRIKAILDSLLEERGELSLEHLRALPCDDIKAQLGRYKGVGPKSIACVMLFCLGRAECPVDTHVWEISKQLGWVGEGASREATYEHLNAVVPDELKYELHVLLVEHGKVCPQCGKRPGTGAKRGKGKAAAAAAAVACPLAPLKRGRRGSKAAAAPSSSSVEVLSSATTTAAAAAAAAASADALVKVEPHGMLKVEAGAAVAAAAAAGGGASPAAAVKLELASVVKVELPASPQGLQQFALQAAGGGATGGAAAGRQGLQQQAAALPARKRARQR